MILFTGDQGEQYGYRDGYQPDGTYWYTGEGQIGDMEMLRGNRAIRDHRKEGKALHLFQYVRSGHVLYVGEGTYLGHHAEIAPNVKGDPSQVVVFELEIYGTDPDGDQGQIGTSPRVGEQSLWTAPLSDVRRRALAKVNPSASGIERRRNVYQRSEAVRVYVLRRAAGSCEGCVSPAPFTTPAGQPYLEPHHIRRVADGGPDHPRWVAALCPTCHRRVHYGSDGNQFNEAIAERIGEKEASSSLAGAGA